MFGQTTHSTYKVRIRKEVRNKECHLTGEEISLTPPNIQCSITKNIKTK